MRRHCSSDHMVVFFLVAMQITDLIGEIIDWNIQNNSYQWDNWIWLHYIPTGLTDGYSGKSCFIFNSLIFWLNNHNDKFCISYLDVSNSVQFWNCLIVTITCTTTVFHLNLKIYIVFEIDNLFNISTTEQKMIKQIRL